MNKLRWGILGTADIARKNWLAIRNSGNGVVTAVGSRDVAKAKKFVEECEREAPMGGVVRAIGSYEELVASPDVDALYIPLPTGIRADWVIEAAKNGKHVVCEKPCAGSAQELRRMIDACRKRKVLFMDGVMFMHSERLDAIRAEMKNIGQVKRISSAFSFHGDKDFYANNIRVNSAMEPFGCLGDLGWYCIRLALWVMGEQLPERVSGRILSEARAKKSPGTVPDSFSGELFFKGGVSSSFYCSFAASDEQWAVITGTKGLVRMEDFVLPFYGNEVGFDVLNAGLTVNGCDFYMVPNRRRVAVKEFSNSHAQAQETNLFRNFAAQVQSGKLNEDWPKIALGTQRVMEACFESAKRDSVAVEF